MDRLVLIAMLATPVTGCEKAAADRPRAQLVARVNGSEITIREMRGAPQGDAAQALEKVIDRELLVQKALAGKLDRDPEVLESIENARRQVLAQAYLDRSASAAAGSTRDEVRSFYAENPALFANRRIYRLRELAVSAPAELIDVLRAEAARSRDLDHLAAWLRARNAGTTAQLEIRSMTQPAEQLPLAFLPQLARMKPGEIAVFATPAGASAMQLVRAEEAPLTEPQAAPLIEQFLAGRKRLESAAAELKRLRELATIEYLGDFKRGN